MNKTEAMAELRKRWGSKARFRVNRNALTGDKRQAVRDSLPALRQAQRDAEEAANARRKALLEGDAEYQALRAAAAEAGKAKRKAESLASLDRIEIGYVSSMAGLSMFHIAGHGDTWGEAFARADKR